MPNEPMISSQIVLPVVDRLREFGIRAAPLLEKLSIDKDLLQDVNALLPLKKYVAFFERAAEAAKKPSFGLEAGSAVEVSTGAINFLFLSAPTLKDAFTGLSDYLGALQESTECYVKVENGLASLTYKITDESIAPCRQDVEYSIAATCRLMTSYIGSKFAPEEVWFEHERVGNHATYEAALGTHVFFGQTSNRIFFDKSLLDISAPSISRKLYPIISSHLEKIVSDRSSVTTFASLVSAQLTQRELVRGTSTKKIAEQLGTSESTIARRLKSEGTSFISVLTEKRMSIAKRLLSHSDSPIGEIALKVGYSENASFSRAFKSWCGQTPEQYRASQ